VRTTCSDCLTRSSSLRKYWIDYKFSVFSFLIKRYKSVFSSHSFPPQKCENSNSPKMKTSSSHFLFFSRYIQGIVRWRMKMDRHRRDDDQWKVAAGFSIAVRETNKWNEKVKLDLHLPLSKALHTPSRRLVVLGSHQCGTTSPVMASNWWTTPRDFIHPDFIYLWWTRYIYFCFVVVCTFLSRPMFPCLVTQAPLEPRESRDSVERASEAA